MRHGGEAGGSGRGGGRRRRVTGGRGEQECQPERPARGGCARGGCGAWRWGTRSCLPAGPRPRTCGTVPGRTRGARLLAAGGPDRARVAGSARTRGRQARTMSPSTASTVTVSPSPILPSRSGIGQLVADLALDDPLERAGAEGRVVALARPAAPSAASVTSSVDAAGRPGGRAGRASWISTMRPRSSSVSDAEPDDVVDAVDELGLEEVARVARQVRRHDQHDVGEVDRAALAVGEAAVVEQLQQHVEHVGVGLLDLVEQHHRVGPAAHRLGELAALVVADVAGGRADEPATRSASPCTRSCRCGPSPARRRTGSRPARGPARSCRRRWGRGTGTSRWAGAGRTGRPGCGGWRWPPR